MRRGPSCEVCGEPAAGIYAYELPDHEEQEGPLCRGCVSRYNSNKLTHVERVGNLTDEE